MKWSQCRALAPSIPLSFQLSSAIENLRSSYILRSALSASLNQSKVSVLGKIVSAKITLLHSKFMI